MIYNKKYFDALISPLQLSQQQTTTLIQGYFRIYDKLGKNPKEIINIVKNYYGSGTSIVYCKENHRSRLVLINMAFKLVKTTSNKLAFRIVNINKRKRKDFKVTNLFSIGKKIQTQFADHITFKFKYCYNKCNKRFVPSWSQIGFISHMTDETDIKNIYHSIENLCFSNFNEASHKLWIAAPSRHVHHNYITGYQYSCVNFTHISQNLTQSDRDIKLTELNKSGDNYVDLNETIEVMCKVVERNELMYDTYNCHFEVANAEFSINGTHDDDVVHNNNNNTHRSKGLKLKKDVWYIPGIAINGCNCDINGGVAYEISCKAPSLSM